MPQVVGPGQIVTVVKDGECRVSITLDLNININQSGEVSASASVVGQERTKIPAKDMDKVEYEIPDFTSDLKVDFGKFK